jgi:hypothetical protein
MNVTITIFTDDGFNDGTFAQLEVTCKRKANSLFGEEKVD